MVVKSTTHMTKAELLEVITDKNRIDDLEGMAVASQTKPLDADVSRLISSLNQRIKALEEKIDG
jgi:hypothetical protein